MVLLLQEMRFQNRFEITCGKITIKLQMQQKRFYVILNKIMCVILNRIVCHFEQDHVCHFE